MQQTKYMRIVAAGLLITLFAACAKDDTIVPYDTTEGIPCTVTLNVGAAPAPEITVTRADNSLSALSSLKIFVYDKDGQVCQNVTTLSSTDITENEGVDRDHVGREAVVCHSQLRQRLLGSIRHRQFVQTGRTRRFDFGPAA